MVGRRELLQEGARGVGENTSCYNLYSKKGAVLERYPLKVCIESITCFGLRRAPKYRMKFGGVFSQRSL